MNIKRQSIESRRFSFTESSVTTLPFAVSRGQRIDFYDTKIGGLQLRVSHNAKTFYVYKKHNGSPLRIKLGEYPGILVAEARALAQDVLYKLARGENPNVEKRSIRDEMTLGELFALALETEFKMYNKSWRESERRYQRHLTPWKNRRLSVITRHDVITLHAKLGVSIGNYEANRVIALLSRLFNIARARGFEKPNPASAIKKFKEPSRERFLQTDELPRFFHAVYSEPNPDIRDFVLLALFTGARKRNVMSMRWSNLDLDRGVWTIAGDEMKNGSTAKIPLGQQALEVLRSRPRKAGNDFVFPTESYSGHLSDPSNAWARLLDRAQIKDLRIHDLRRSLGSWQAATGASLTIIGKSLNHKSLASTQIYARLELDPVRESVEKAARAMLNAARSNADDDSRVGTVQTQSKSVSK